MHHNCLVNAWEEVVGKGGANGKGSTAFSLELMKGKKVLFLSSTSSRFLGRTHYLVRYI